MLRQCSRDLWRGKNKRSCKYIKMNKENLYVVVGADLFVREGARDIVVWEKRVG